MKVPTKAELYHQVAELQKLNQKQAEQLEAEKREAWEKRIPEATLRCLRQLHEIFPYAVTNLRYEHVDGGGYWFTFEIRNDDRRQTYCVRHTDMEE